MHIRRKISWLVLPVAVALLAAGCGGGSGSGEADSEGAISVYGTDPENPLIPANTTEVGGGYPVEDLFANLVQYSGKDFSASNLMAESIDTTDNVTFDIKIKKGWKFHNGEEVTADNFTKAWNYAVSNGLANSSFMEDIDGYDDALGEVNEDGTLKKASGKDMKGLEVKNDYEFTVTLSGPLTIFPTKLGYSAFSPMPDMFFEDRAAYEKKPIGNGPLRFVEYRPNAYIKLTRFDDYKGDDAVQFKDLEYRIYPGGREPAYQDLISGELDFMEEMPPSAIAGKRYEAEFGDRLASNKLLEHQMISFPLYDKKVSSPDLHKAISMAINRDQITKQVFEGTKLPMDGWVPANMPGSKPGACGEFCKYNPEEAKKYLQKSGFTGPLTISSNTDGGHKEWIEAICGNIENALGIECNFTPSTSFGAFRERIEAREMTGLYRNGWVADYPAIENFLAPLYKSNGSSNDNDYSNPQFDKLVEQANAAPEESEATGLYQQAEALLKEQMASIPLWTQEGVGAYSENISNVQLTPKRRLDISTVTVTG